MKPSRPSHPSAKQSKSTTSPKGTRAKPLAVFTNPAFTGMLGLVVGFAFCWVAMAQPYKERLAAQEESLRQWERINRMERQAVATMKSISIEELRKWVATLDEQNTRYAELQRLLHEQEVKLTDPAFTYIAIAAVALVVVFVFTIFVMRDANADAARTLDNAVAVLPALRASIQDQLADAKAVDVGHQLTGTAGALALSDSSQLLTGTVKRFFADKNYGYILPDDGDDDLFFHRNELVVPKGRQIREGARVTFWCATDKQGRPCAKGVEMTE